jgi:peptidoglycan/LPS O-acetylase OafA/YrhL
MDALMYGVGLALIVRNERAFALAVRWRWLLDLLALWILYQFLTLGNFDWFWKSPTNSPFPPLKQTAMALLWAIMILRVFTYQRSYFNRIWLNPLLIKLGLISYALYMYHQAVNGLVHGILFGQVPLITNWWQFLAALGVMAIAICLATLSYVYFEKPIRRYGHQLADRLSTRSTPAVAASPSPQSS